MAFKKVILFAINLGLGISSTAYAIGPANTPAGIGTPITSYTAYLLDKGGWSITEFAEYYRDRPFANQVLLDNPEAQNQSGTFTNYLFLFYGLSKNITLASSLPYTHKSNLQAAIDTESDMRSVTHLGNISGAGDSSFFALTKLFDEAQQPFTMSLIFGTNAPTGKTNARDINNTLFSSEDQPSNGAWGAFGGIITSKEWTKLQLNTNITYTQNTRGKQNTRIGSILDYKLSAVYALHKNEQKHSSFNCIVELDGAYYNKDNISGITDPQSGGNNLFALIGLRDTINDNVSVYVGSSTPLIEQYNGVQLKTNYAVVGGVDISF